MDAWVIKIDGDDGALYWQTTIGRWNNDIAESICKTPGGDFLVAGRSNSSFRVIMVKLMYLFLD